MTTDRLDLERLHAALDLSPGDVTAPIHGPFRSGQQVRWLDARHCRHGTTFEATVVRVGRVRVTLDVRYGARTLRRSVSPDRVFAAHPTD